MIEQRAENQSQPPAPIVPCALAGAALLGLFVSFSRGGWFAFLGTAMLLAFLTGRRRLALAVAGTALALAVVLPLTGVDRLTQALNSEAGSGALRLEVWRSTLAMIGDYPITGVGLDQFLYQYNPRYVAPEAWGERFTSHPHNLLLDFWVRLGILGLATGIAMFGLPLWNMVSVTLGRPGRTVPTDRMRRALAAGAGGVIAYSLLHGLVDNSFFLPDLALTFWLAVTVLARAVRNDESV
jgi:putative inorganic carbon (HCO3(-)) transporter